MEYHALHTANRAARRIEELSIACAAMGDEKARRDVFRMFQKKTEDRGRMTEGGSQTEPESEMPLSAEDFRRMIEQRD